MCQGEKKCKKCTGCPKCKIDESGVLTENCEKCQNCIDCEKCEGCEKEPREENCNHCKGNIYNRSDFKAIRERLEDGNKRFRGILENKPNYSNQDKNRRECTAEKGQKPFAIVLSCADSRVPPELIFDTGIGDLFVVRVAGNIANTSSIASIEFAVAALGCRYILVLGHEGCGAVQAAINGGDAGSDSLNHLVCHIKPAVEKCRCKSHVKAVEEKKDYNYEAISKNIKTVECLEKVTIENALLVKKLLEKNEIIEIHKVKIDTGYYKLASGEVNFDLSSEC